MASIVTQSLRTILSEELSYFTDHDLYLTPERIFDPSEAKRWLIRLLSNEPGDMTVLSARIAMSDKRISHVISTYLLGNVVRRQLKINFGMLPRIFPIHAHGDAFEFFWAVICLCHDLGYQFEDDSRNLKIDDLSRMASLDRRKGLLGIKYDMLSLKPEDIDQSILGLTHEESQWVKDSITLIQKYERYRREQCKLIDHGVAGGLILYDLLHNLAYKKPQIEQRFRGQTIDTRPVLGELSSNSSQDRFMACALLIACTVARHNIWTTSQPCRVSAYKRYGLDELCFSDGMYPQNRINFQKEQDEMLFFLGMLDTIDPVKGLYLRDDIQSVCYQDVLDRVSIASNLGDSLCGYQSFCVQIDNANKDGVPFFKDDLLKRYFSSWISIPEWLQTSASVCKTTTQGICYFPILPNHEWPVGISESEIRALCLYEGDRDGSRAEAFWRTPNAYQTINLLMMDGLDGERVRVCIEKQNPHGLYIENWKETLGVLCDIYKAQLKCRELPKPKICYRVERHENFNQIYQKQKTFSFFSTSKDRYLTNLANQKERLILFEIETQGDIPFIDYEAILKKNYLYSDEREVLFPPFLTVSLQEKQLEDESLYPFDRNGNPPEKLYHITLSAAQWQEAPLLKPDAELISLLEMNKETAAAVLRRIRNQRSIENISSDDLTKYKQWKKCFQTLVFNRLKELSFGSDMPSPKSQIIEQC